MFDPNDPKHQQHHRLEEAGTYVLVFDKLVKRDRTKNDKPFLLLVAKVIHGPQRGKEFLERVFLSEVALWRLAHLCAAIGFSEPFDLRSDSDVSHALLHRPFKALVSVEERGGDRYAGIDRPIGRGEVLGDEASAMDQWVAAHEHEQVDGVDDVSSDGADIPF